MAKKWKFVLFYTTFAYSLSFERKRVIERRGERKGGREGGTVGKVREEGRGNGENGQRGRGEEGKDLRRG